MTESKSCASKQNQGGIFMEQELAYSFHLGSDKNKSKIAKKQLKEMYLVLLLYQIMLYKMQMIYLEQINTIYEIMIIKGN